MRERRITEISQRQKWRKRIYRKIKNTEQSRIKELLQIMWHTGNEAFRTDRENTIM